MRAATFSTVLALSILAKLTSATPACLLACVSQVNKESSSCETLNQIKCTCENDAEAVQTCLSSICPSGDVDAAQAAFKATCGETSVEVSSAASGSASKSASKSGSGSASASAGSDVSTSASGNGTTPITSHASAPTNATSVPSQSSDASSSKVVVTQTGEGFALNAPVGVLLGGAAAAIGLLL